MKPHMPIRLLMIVLLLMQPFLIYWSWANWPLFAVVAALPPLCMVIPALLPNCRFYGPVIRRFTTDKKEVWLTIDDGPHPEDTPRILELLRCNRAHATFFVVGERLRKYPQVARAILREGHQLANHSDTHPAWTFWDVGGARLRREVENCAASVREIVSEPAPWFRAPVGMANCFVHAYLYRRGIKLIGWSARGFDGVPCDPEKVVARIAESLRPGSIILLHEGRHDSKGGDVNVRCVALLLAKLSAEGYACVLPGDGQLR